MENIQNKVIVITGASMGIGAPAARKLSKLGIARLVFAARREDQSKGLNNDLAVFDYVGSSAKETQPYLK